MANKSKGKNKSANRQQRERYSEKYGSNRPNPYTGYLPPGREQGQKIYHPEAIDANKLNNFNEASAYIAAEAAEREVIEKKAAEMVAAERAERERLEAELLAARQLLAEQQIAQERAERERLEAELEEARRMLAERQTETDGEDSAVSEDESEPEERPVSSFSGIIEQERAAAMRNQQSSKPSRTYSPGRKKNRKRPNVDRPQSAQRVTPERMREIQDTAAATAVTEVLMDNITAAAKSQTDNEPQTEPVVENAGIGEVVLSADIIGESPAPEPQEADGEVIAEPIADTAEDAIDEMVDDLIEDIDEEIAEVQQDLAELGEEPVEEVALDLTEEIIEEPAEEVALDLTEEIIEEPAEEVALDLTEEIIEEPVEEIAPDLTEEIIEEPVGEVVEEPVGEEPAEEVIEEPVEEPVEELTEVPDEDAPAGIEDEPVPDSEDEDMKVVEPKKSSPHKKAAVASIMYSQPTELSEDGFSEQDETLFLRKEKASAPTAVFDMPEGVHLPGYTDDDEFLNQWLSEGEDEMIIKDKRRRRRVSTILGTVTILLALVGFGVVVSFIANSLSGLGSTTSKNSEYESFIAPVVLSDPEPFETWEGADKQKLLECSILALTTAEGANYTIDGTNRIVIPSADVSGAAKRLFGPLVELDLSALNEVEGGDLYYYSEADDCFHVAITGISETQPVIIGSPKRDGSTITLVVGYLSQSALIDGEAAADEENPYYKTMVYVLKQLDSSYYISALREYTEG